ncbi:MAG TPA: class I SAM-dependent rRNA methyltransferase [Ardenticatenaceae bacterium]|nr:class I SAM-dependent rRNA methyltransferase [Ardenticatenaceae bacterium]
MVASVVLKQGREKPVRQGHPWVFSGAIAREPSVAAGAIVDVRDAHNGFLARGYFNPASQIRVRLLTWNEREQVDTAFWRRRLVACVERRAALTSPDTNAYRLVAAEADRLPGLIVDRYGDWVVVQALTAGIDVRSAEIAGLIDELLRPAGIYERSDEAVRELEGLAPRAGTLSGSTPPPDGVEILEHTLRYVVDIVAGHKTGFYLDQRENRRLVGARAAGCRVLNCFSYTGGFSVAAAAAGAASVLSVDSSEPALRVAERNLALNGLENRAGDVLLLGNVFEVLRSFRQEGRRFDLIVLDPPKFAHSAGQVEAACRGYKDINLLAFQLLEVGGWLATFSCSGLVSADLFQKVVFGAAHDARVEAQIVQTLMQAPDHPVLLSFPESAYLKGLLCRKIAEVN